jgi:histone H4
MSVISRGKEIHLNRSHGNLGQKTLHKRHRRMVLRDASSDISKADIRRLARRGGVKRISGVVYGYTRAVLKIFLEKIIGTAVIYTEHSKRKTVNVHDIIHSLKHHGRVLYGFGDSESRIRSTTSRRKNKEK